MYFYNEKDEKIEHRKRLRTYQIPSHDKNQLCGSYRSPNVLYHTSNILITILSIFLQLFLKILEGKEENCHE